MMMHQQFRPQHLKADCADMAANRRARGSARKLARLLALGCSVLAFAGLTGCATTHTRPTPYAATDVRGFGYFDQQISNDRYRVGFRGNSYTSREQVEDSILLRSAELAIAGGFEWFEVVERAVEANRRQVVTPDPFDDGFYGFARFSYFSPRYGWVMGYDPFYRSRFGHSTTVREFTRFEATAEVRFGRGPKPENGAKVYEAQAVKAAIAPRLAAVGALVVPVQAATPANGQ